MHFKNITHVLTKVKTFESLTNADFRLYWSGLLLQWAAMFMNNTTQSFLVYHLTGSSAILGAMSLAIAVPQLIFSLFGGALADRFQKKRLLQLSQSASLVVAIVITVLLATGFLSPQNRYSWWVLIATSVFSGMFAGLSIPARQAMIPELVSRERLTNAVSLSTAAQNICMLLSPALAGFLIDGFGFEASYIVISLLLASAVIITNFLPATTSKREISPNPLVDIIQGIKYIRSNKEILLILVFTLVIVTLGMPRSQMIAIFANDILKVGASGMGILQSTAGIGALIASLGFTYLPSKNRGKIMMGFAMVMGIALIIFSFSKSMPLSIASNLFIGLGQVHLMVGTVLLQMKTPPVYMGRVMSILLMSTAFGGVSTFATGLIAEWTGAPIALGIMSCSIILITLYFWLFQPVIRKSN